MYKYEVMLIDGSMWEVTDPNAYHSLNTEGKYGRQYDAVPIHPTMTPGTWKISAGHIIAQRKIP